jgi:hypothetical protein
MLLATCPDLTVSSSGRAAPCDLDRSRHEDRPRPPALRRQRSSPQQGALECWMVRLKWPRAAGPFLVAAKFEICLLVVPYQAAKGSVCCF